MPISPSQIASVQNSWLTISTQRDEVALLFYDNLFDLAPHLKRLLTSGLPTQRDKFIEMLDHAVNALSRLDSIEEDLYKLGERHSEYGIDEAHFDTAAIALLTTLEQVLTDDFDEPLKEAWARAYWILAGVMKKGMRRQ